MSNQMNVLRASIVARVPALLWGAPGIGKTAIIEQLAHDMGMGFVPLAVSTRMAEDFSGLPIPGPDGVRQEPLSWLRRAIRLAESNPNGCIVLLDEFSCAPQSVQAALLSLIQSRYCGDTAIPRSVAFVAAANPVGQAADGWELPAPTVSRWVHLQWPAPDAESWASWLVGRTPAIDDSPAWRGEAGSRARAFISAYLMKRPSRLAPALSPDRGAGAYPCPRSWENACRLVAEVIPPTGDITPMLGVCGTIIEGAVGAGDTVELLAYLRESDFPDPNEILTHPESWKPDPQRPDKAWAILSSIFGAVVGRLGPDGVIPVDRWEAAWRIVDRAFNHGARATAFSALAEPLAQEMSTGGRAQGRKISRDIHVILSDLVKMKKAAGV